MCNILAKTKDLSHEEWLSLRKNGIGGSDAGALCGVNPYTSANAARIHVVAYLTEERYGEYTETGQ